MKKSDKLTIGIIIAVIIFVIFAISIIIYGVFWFLGYRNPVQRYSYKVKTDAALEKKYPGHDFDVREEHGWGEYGYSVGLYGTDEEGIEFLVQWVDDEMQDRYREEYNKYYYGEKLVDYQNALRDQYFPQIPYVDSYEYDSDDKFYFNGGPYKEEFFESMDDAIEGSKSCLFDTDVTFTGIDLYTADDEEIEMFAESMADSLMWLYDVTGYEDIRINSFTYHAADEYGNDGQTRDELIESIKKDITTMREHK